jgi:hypothetical protein
MWVYIPPMFDQVEMIGKLMNSSGKAAPGANVGEH